MFNIVSSETDRGSLRLRFLAGSRVLSTLASAQQRELQLSALLSSPPLDHVRVVEGFLEDKKRTTKAMKVGGVEGVCGCECVPYYRYML